MSRASKALFIKVPSARSVSDKGALTHVLSCPSEKTPQIFRSAGWFRMRGSGVNLYKG